MIRFTKLCAVLGASEERSKAYMEIRRRVPQMSNNEMCQPRKSYVKKILEWGAYALVFLLPWQTVWIIQQKMIGRTGTSFEGVWQYGTTRLYAIEGLIVFLMLVVVCGAVRTIYIRGDVRAALGTWYRSRLFYLDGCLVLFLVLSLCSIVWAPDRIVAIMTAFRILEGIFLFVLFRTLQFRTPLLVSFALGGVVLQGVLGSVQFLMQGISASTLLGIATHDPATLGDAVVQAGDRRWLRAYGAFPHPNILGAYLVVGMVVCARALSCARKKWQWVLLLISSQIIFVGMLFTFSRSAWLALVTAGTVWAILFLLHRRGRGSPTDVAGALPARDHDVVVNPLALLVFISVLTAGMFGTYFFDEIRGRVGVQPSRLERQSIDERVSSIFRAMPLLKETWYRGTGIGNFTNALFLFEQKRDIDKEWYSYQPLHNVFFMIFAELGILGVVFICLILFLFIRLLSSTSYLLPSVLLVLSLFDHFLWTLPFGIFFGALVLGRCYFRE
ncbi:MAG: O-antigen ligase family protein [Candidatus Uhrbacteria bacterium]|nr:O-antigen ligase family protein [Candidatus Uhrbacteria bacterium]